MRKSERKAEIKTTRQRKQRKKEVKENTETKIEKREKVREIECERKGNLSSSSSRMPQLFPLSNVEIAFPFCSASTPYE